jgi:hypothetical protein
VAATGSAARVSSSGALLTGTVNPGGSNAVTYAFSYGTSSSQLDRSTPAGTQPGSSTAAPVTATLTGLNQTTTYYFRLDVSFGGQTYSGAVQTFRTPASPPTVNTGRASKVDGQGGAVSGSVNRPARVTRRSR